MRTSPSVRRLPALLTCRKSSLAGDLSLRARRAVAMLASVGALTGALTGVAGSPGAGQVMATATPALMSAAGQYFPVPPAKVLGTRSGVGGVSTTPLAANGSVSFPVTSVGQVPQDGSGTFTQDIKVSVEPSTADVTLVQGTAALAMVDSNGVTNSPAVIADTSDVFTANGATNGEACDISRVNGVTVHTHKPFNNYASHNSFSTDWINHLFSVRNARKVSGVAQWEGVLCTVGGASTWNGWTLGLAEDSIFTDSTNANTLWNREWSSRATNTSSISKTLGFSTTAPENYASINGGESMTFKSANAELTGGVGSDGHWGSEWPSKYNQYNPTRVNAEWGAVNINGLTSDFEGSVGLALYMYPMGTGPHHFYSLHITKSACLSLSCPPLY